jgi:hypothetical protein
MPAARADAVHPAAWSIPPARVGAAAPLDQPVQGAKEKHRNQLGARHRIRPSTSMAGADQHEISQYEMPFVVERIAPEASHFCRGHMGILHSPPRSGQARTVHPGLTVRTRRVLVLSRRTEPSDNPFSLATGGALCDRPNTAINAVPPGLVFRHGCMVDRNGLDLGRCGYRRNTSSWA